MNDLLHVMNDGEELSHIARESVRVFLILERFAENVGECLHAALADAIDLVG
jgi:hypothetical protein